MTDQLPSKEWLLQAANALEHYAKSRWYYSPLFYPDIAVALRQLVEGRAEIARLREDLQRTESARVALLAENEHYKQRVEELSIHAEKWVKRALGALGVTCDHDPMSQGSTLECDTRGALICKHCDEFDRSRAWPAQPPGSAHVHKWHTADGERYECACGAVKGDGQ